MHSMSSSTQRERWARRVGGNGTPRELWRCQLVIVCDTASRVRLRGGRQWRGRNVRVGVGREGEGEEDCGGRLLSLRRRWEETKEHGAQ